MSYNLFNGHYEEWRAKRLALILDYYGASFFMGKKVLELGCGYGDIGGPLSILGAKVTCLDARLEHLRVINSRFPSVDTLLCDLDVNYPEDHYDISIHMGVLYHLRDYKNSIKQMCSYSDHMVLETEVSDSDDPDFCSFAIEEGYDQAKNGIGSRPSAVAIEKTLEEHGMHYTRIFDKRLNSGIHRYDWDVRNTNLYKNSLRRFWFIDKYGSHLM